MIERTRVTQPPTATAASAVRFRPLASRMPTSAGDRVHVVDRRGSLQPLALDVARLERRIDLLTQTRATGGNAMSLFVDGRNAYPELYRVLGAATKTIHMEMYIFGNDDTSWDMAQLLAEKASQGVKVRLTTDWIGSPTQDPIYEFMRANGVEVRHHTPNNVRNPAQADHRKIIVVDGATGITGGMNVKNEYRDTWHDAIVRMEGPVVHDLQRTFLQTWSLVGGKPAGEGPDVYAPLSAHAPGQIPMRVLTTDPGQDLRKALFAAIDSARSRINLENPYFTDDVMIDRLVAAAQRGVKVRVIVPAVSDVTVVKAASRHHFNRLLQAGAEVYLYQSRMVHTKAATVDGVWGTLGSCNADNLSLRVNREMNVTFSDPQAVADVDNCLFGNDFQHSVKLERVDMSLHQRLGTWLARQINRIL